MGSAGSCPGTSQQHLEGGGTIKAESDVGNQPLLPNPRRFRPNSAGAQQAPFQLSLQSQQRPQNGAAPPKKKKLGASKQVCPLLHGGVGGLSPVIALRLQSSPRGSRLNPRVPAASWAPQPRLGRAGGGLRGNGGFVPGHPVSFWDPPRGGSSTAGRMGVRGWWLCPGPRGWCRDTTPRAPSLGAQTGPPPAPIQPRAPQKSSKEK